VYAVDIVLVVGEGEWNRIEVGTTLDTIGDVVEATRDYVKGPLRDIYPALYCFTEFGLQAVESFAVAMAGGSEYTATIGTADMSAVPIPNRQLAAEIAAKFVTALHVQRKRYVEPALKLLATEHTRSWERVSFKVEPGPWLSRHLRGEDGLGIDSLKA
jgi:hypothetical protein